MLFTILFLVAAVFLVYAVMTQYYNAPPGNSVLKRVVTAIGLAAAALGAAVMSWIHGMTAP